MTVTSKKIKSRPALRAAVKKARSAGKKVGFTNGCFDILHLGHVKYLEAAKKECDILVAGVNSDASVRRLKGPARPVNDEKARLTVLAAVESIDYVTLFGEDTPEKLIRSLTPDVIFKGGDWKEKDIVGGSHVKSAGGRVRVIPYVKGFSTTRMIERLKKA